MKPSDDEDLPSLEAIEGQLRSDLSSLQRDLDALAGEGFGQYADDGAEGFERSVHRLEDTVGDLRRALDRLVSVGPVDLSKVAAESLSTLLLEVEKPLVLHVAWDQTLAHPAVPGEALRAVVTRMMSLVVRHVEGGDGLTFRTLQEREEAVLRIVVTPNNPFGMGASFEGFTLRCQSIGDFVEELGGRFVLEAGQELTLELRLKLGVGVL